MTEVGKQDMCIVDVRPTRPNETLLCRAQAHGERWAQYVVTSDIDPRTLSRKPVMTYLCRSCLTQFLTLSSGLGVG